LARLESGVMQLRYEPFSLNDLVHAAVHDRQLTASARQIRLQHTSSGSVPLVMAEIAPIARVLENLLDNAMRHTPDAGFVTVAVGTRVERVTVSVSNTGSSISTEELPFLFDRFRRFDRERGGAGLGLAIAQKIVALHASEIEVESRPGEETVFWLSLPAVAPS
jgi:two-component system, OmpR family, sensor kinase